MKILRNAIVLVVLLGVLAVIKMYLLRKNEDSLIFYFNLLTCMQIFLLGNFLLWLLMSGLSWAFRKKYFSYSASVIMFIALLAFGEIICIYLMNHAEKAKGQWHYYLEEYYMSYERQVPEVRKDCACYDSTLLYTYLPKSFCVQENIEFKDTFSINSSGLRDDEASLQSPEIICLGDSYTAGWGVGQSETYPDQIQAMTGMKVLNAGISSYGTAREVMMLKRLDTSNLKCIIIQYCLNDMKENEKYLQNNFHLPISTRAQYEESVRKHEWATIYFPFKKILTLSRILMKDKSTLLFKNRHSPEQAETLKKYDRDTSYVPRAAKDFIAVLSSANISVPVFVIDVNRYPHFDHHFIQKASENAPQNVHFVDISPLNDPNYFFPLDGHLNAEGHKTLAKIIIDKISIQNSAFKN